MQIYVHEYIRFSAALIYMQCTAYRLQPLPFYANQKKFSFFSLHEIIILAALSFRLLTIDSSQHVFANIN